MNRFYVGLALTMVLLAGAAGCGQKGPLYMPEEQSAAMPAGAVTPNASQGTQPPAATSPNEGDDAQAPAAPAS